MNLIYSYWDGEILESCQAGVDAMRNYAQRIGVQYQFDDNPRFLQYNVGNFTPHFGILKLIYDTSFDDYEDILFVDTDVFPIENLNENIFDYFHGDIGIVSEGFVGDLSEHEHDMWYKWNTAVRDSFGVTIPTRKDGLPRILNTGVVLFSKQARLQAREKWMDVRKYIKFVSRYNLNEFFTCDQPYIHMMIYLHDMDVQLMGGEWNTQLITQLSVIDGNLNIRHRDYKNDETKFVHVRLEQADFLSKEDHHKLVNSPKDSWPDYVLNYSYLRGYPVENKL